MKIRILKEDGHHNLSQREKEDLFKRGLNIFKKVISDSGVLQEVKKREFYESPGEKRRRKKKEMNLIRKKNSKPENF
jgi:small subunit ribosomal protein S21